MAGTDRSRASAAGGPAIVLVAPQLGENIGMVARAMLNCGLGELRLVRPRDGWPSEQAQAAASGADGVLESARLFETTAEAVADLSRVYATTARPRDMVKTVVTPARAAEEMRRSDSALKTGVLFGPERSGLVNDDLALADSLIVVPLNPAFASLNLAQAVLLIGYEWFKLGDATPESRLETGRGLPAEKADLITFFERLEKELDAAGFLTPPEKRPVMVRNLRNLFQRLAATDQDLRTLHGIISALKAGRRGAD